MTGPVTEWPCAPQDAARAIRLGKTWTLLSTYVERPCPMTLDLIHELATGWVTIRGRRQRVPGGPITGQLGALQSYRAPGGATYWQWVPVDDPGSWTFEVAPLPAVTA